MRTIRKSNSFLLLTIFVVEYYIILLIIEINLDKVGRLIEIFI